MDISVSCRFPMHIHSIQGHLFPHVCYLLRVRVSWDGFGRHYGGSHSWYGLTIVWLCAWLLVFCTFSSVSMPRRRLACRRQLAGQFELRLRDLPKQILANVQQKNRRIHHLPTHMTSPTNTMMHGERMLPSSFLSSSHGFIWTS